MTVDGILLAAGFSERAPNFKPALDLCGKPLLVRTIESLIDLCEKIIVVGGHNFVKLSEVVREIPKVMLVKNQNFEAGMFSSVKCGIRHVSARRFFLLPGDQPVVMQKTLELMLANIDNIVIPRYFNKKGHPVLFNSALIPEILTYPNTEILRNYIHSKVVKIIDVDDPGIGMDVDTPEDYQRVLNYYKERFLPAKQVKSIQG
ncbi:MAG: nucleotidyltransferase family protein [Candidatus Marinimicrobia bacterium]|nr:nucleotidyltransferase family protein [Candidatus Neomarinimicrobiota bacterium]